MGFSPWLPTLFQPPQWCLSLHTWAHLPCWTMPGSTCPFQSCIILLGVQKNNFGAETSSQRAQEHHLHKAAFCSWSCLITQPALFPQVTCLQNKEQQKKGPKLRLLYIIKSPGRFFLAVTEAVLCPDREESGGSESSLLRVREKGQCLLLLGVLGLSLCFFNRMC